MKKIHTSVVLMLVAWCAAAQEYDKNYRRLSSGDLTVDKNFYLLTVIDKTPEVRAILAENVALKAFLQGKVEMLNAHVTDTCSYPVSLVGDFFWQRDTASLA